MNRFLVFGGSFDPFHYSHKDLIDYFSTPVSIIPTYNPFKESSLFTLKERIDMIKEIYFANGSYVEEFTLTDPLFFSYMVNIVLRIEKDNPNKEICLIMGDDTYNSIHRWKDFNQIQDKITCLVFNRDSIKNDKIKIHHNIKTELIDLNIKKNSSTEIREFLKVNRLDYIEKLIPKEIYESSIFQSKICLFG